MSPVGPLVIKLSFFVQALCLLSINEISASEDEFYRAVVVEYSPLMDSSLDAKTNMMNNVHRTIKLIKQAIDQFSMVDLMMFPEIGIQGYGNQQYAIEVPNPSERVVPCAHDTQYEAPLVQLSCAAHATGLYLVVNLEERGRDAVSYNTDVVFDPDGAIVARYRKINLFDEGHKTPGPKELTYFDTNFGVRFGIFTCFDIIFKLPGVELARTLNITHFIFPTAWFSELPFLTAVQEQWYWSYTLDVVLLAAGYNLPNVGSTGTGLYVGRKGPAAYNLTMDRGTFMIYAKIPKNFREPGISVKDLSVKRTDLVPVSESNSTTSQSKLNLKRDFLDVYETEPITVPQDAPIHLNGSEVFVPFSLERTICHGFLCCNFSIQVIAKYKSTRPPSPRPDDYSTLHYRLAAFDGVRHYDHMATGGLQTCAILPCANEGLASCGLPADDAAADVARLDYLYQTGLEFNSVKISGNFSNNNTFVGPNVLLKGNGNNYGSLLTSDQLAFDERSVGVDVTLKTLRTLRPIEGLVTASIYGRVFGKDGQPYTGADTDKARSSPAFDTFLNLILTVIALVLIKISLI